MCDTFITFNTGKANHSFFAKNSDRDPGEPQIIQFINNAKEDFKSDFLIEKLKKYTNGPLKNLISIFKNYDHPYSALISRPTWMWGAEMGVNEHGVAIGNEAVFSTEPQNKEGLLGMDILRLALHNSKTADEAADFITSIIEKYGQGGNGSYSGNLKYHNSFLIKDFNQAIVIETSGKRWVKDASTSSCSISNAYSLNGTNYIADEKSKNLNFKKRLENRFYTFFSKGDFRQEYTSKAAAEKANSLQEIFSILRSHIHNTEKITWGMKSVCVHPGILVKSETTMSMVVEYTDDKFVVWHNSSPNPCVSIYKPLIISNNECFHLFNNTEESLKYYITNSNFSKKLVKNYKYFKSQIEKPRDLLEDEFINLINKNLESKLYSELNQEIIQCYEKEKVFRDSFKTT